MPVCMRAQGWRSGDMHVHRPAANAAGIAQAEDLNFMVLVNPAKRKMNATAVPGYSMASRRC